MTKRSILQAFAVLALLLTTGGILRSAQSRRTPMENAESLLRTGQYDLVESSLRDETTPLAVTLRARAYVARGRYEDALSLLTPAVAAAPLGDAALELGLLHMYLGRTDEANRILQRLIKGTQARTAMDYLRVARALHAMGDFGGANDRFREAEKLSPKDAEINALWGLMQLEKNDPDAKTSLEIALSEDSDHVDAIVGLARLERETNQPAAAQFIQRALKINPNSVQAYLVAAEMALDNRERQDAHTSIDKALEINPNSLEARTLDAALAFLEDRTAEFEQKAQAVLTLNPVYSEVYRVAGDHATRNYRFAEAIPLTRKALDIDPNNARAHADLGLELLRVGDEAGARVELEAAFKGDPFYSSLVTKNLLEMLDHVETFVTVQEGDVLMRFDPEEAGVMREQAVPLAREALDALSKRWNFTPEGPILIEMFPVHDDFAVRTLGLPGMVGALGVCFGKVVALDSPHARPPGEYNWQPTLWHELAHVITLQMSNNRIPRWLSEGISQWEEKRARPEWGWEMEVSFAHAVDQGKTIKLATFNEAFGDPKLISLAYYQASLVAQHLAETFGEPALQKLVRSYSRGITDEQAFQEAFGQTLEQVQASFDARVDKEYAALRTALKRPSVEGTPDVDALKTMAESNPGSFALQVALGQALDKAGDAAGAIQALERAAALVPRATGDDNPHKLIAAIAEKQGDRARAIRALQDVLKIDHADVESARKLAALSAQGTDNALKEDAYRRVINVDPFDANAQAALGRLLMARRDHAGAVRAFRSAIAARPADAAVAHVDLAEAYLASGKTSEAKAETLQALEIAPSFERAQELLLKLVEPAER